MTRLLIVDDSPLMRKLLAGIFSDAGDFEVAVARSAAEALQQLSVFLPDVITLDIHMPGMDGLDCLDRIMVEHPCPVVMVSALTEEGATETLEALALGAVDFIAKPRGPISLGMDDITDVLIAKVRAASHARLPRTKRLTERVRLQAGQRKFAAPKPVAKSLRRRSGRRLVDIGAVVIGVSTGGPPALDRLLGTLPHDFPWPVLIAQHMPASFTGPLARRLDRGCALPVSEVTAPAVLTPGHIYVGRGDADLIVSKRGSAPMVMPAPPGNYLWHPSVERLVTSAADVLGPERLVGVLMTGMGTDGAQALAQVRAQGGHVVAQDEDSAVVWGMPGALVASDGADCVLPLDDIAPYLVGLALG
ncbi:chemotaxis-specific protein-glutamate methyltransferase CheB [Flavisphingomonas formosensis]|uniref:chemotaxis-specific protein-glutamate methyltransferase CheB n=1 Tax=Flavisphingomonas formosensis TaxID=861534 RepID=UPI0012F89250|nr:chemotaxis-specific protein-glutamate methyltransferase CheB [Sphingomonas formosensis]